MNRLFKGLTVAALSLATSAVFASPTYLIIHNRTNVESNAYIDGTIDSHQPTKANSDGKVHWAVVRMICFGHIVGGNCGALIKMATNTSNPVNLGWLNLNIESGVITPTEIRANGYTIKVNGPGEATITKD
ncbi:MULTISPECIES: hypothetical protein [unclassified Legionella]|uniref:hypothetical protein n=1 Tax=unclassified Legionella TaxID=2622702 RepID=UPI001E5F424B|nr:hypothetical protein [Legionella sp. 31fI33]MCC5015497.1 hypothetical protein [Legionella sp. 31fI33]